jgi:transcriptional regulator with XRE-family HTH domain
VKDDNSVKSSMAFNMSVDLGKIEQLRKRAGLTQAEIAAKLGWTRGRWNNIVKGRSSNLSINTLDRIAGALGVDAADLLVHQIRKTE